MIDGVATFCQGTFNLSWYEGKRLVRKSVGKDPDKAVEALHKKEAELLAKAKGHEIVPEKTKGPTLADAVVEYLHETKLSKKPKTLSAYRNSLTYFQESCSKVYLRDIVRTDLLQFAAFLRDEKDQSPRTCWNKFSNVMSFLKAQGLTGLAKKEDWPRFVEAEVETYDSAELEQLFAACDPDERLLFRFFLMSGFREQEAMYCTWKDVNFTESTVSVRHKPQYGWTPKAYKEREVPIPAELLKELKEAKKTAPNALPCQYRTA
jgi:integrase